MFEIAARRVVGVALLALIGTTLATPVAGQTWRTVTSSRQLWGREPVTVRVEYGAGELTLRPAPAGTLYRMEMRYDEDAITPLTSFNEETRTLRLGIEGREGHRSMRVREGSRANIALSREVPLDLDIEFGAGEAEIDLGGLRLRRLSLSTGASSTVVSFDEPNPIRAERVEIEAGAADLTVKGLGNLRADRVSFQGGVGATVLDFSGAWQGSSAASVEMGMGSVVLRVPRGVGVRLDRSSFLTSFEADGLTRRGGSYFSANWDRAASKLTIDVEAALGSIEVDWVD